MSAQNIQRNRASKTVSQSRKSKSSQPTSGKAATSASERTSVSEKAGTAAEPVPPRATVMSIPHGFVIKKQGATVSKIRRNQLAAMRPATASELQSAQQDVARPGIYASAALFDTEEDGDGESHASNDQRSAVAQKERSARKTTFQRARKTLAQASAKALDTTAEDEREICRVVHNLTIREATLHNHQRLPFLRRNLRKVTGGHEDHSSSSTAVKLKKVYVLRGKRMGGFYSFDWRCPLCRIKMQFESRRNLEIHLKGFHSDSHCEWAEVNKNEVFLTINLPEVEQSSDESGDESSDADNSSEGDVVITKATLSLPLVDHSYTGEDKKPYLQGPSVVRAQSIGPSSPEKSMKVQPISPKLRPTGVQESVPDHLHLKSKAEIIRPAKPIDPDNPDRYPTPPPADNLEGPAAVYPYISGMMYSCRPGGPRLFDILNEIPLNEFTYMSWAIIEREEEIFELPHIRDEDKVMHALWDRYIFKHRQAFIRNYALGVLDFINIYWRYIHRAAGYAALRILLLTLAKNRFLKLDDVANALKYYRDLVGMDLWKS